MTDQIYLQKTCRACQGRLEEVLNLGSLRLNAFPQHAHLIPLIPQVPLILTVCRECGLCQLDRTVPPDWMYRTYYYRSGVNETMVAELESIVYEAGHLAALQDQDWVLDIGANDGTLLSHYPKVWPAYRLRRAAIDPALNLQERLAQHADVTVAGYFPRDATLEGTGFFKIITAIACSYDLEDPLGFFTAIHDQLAPGGVALIQFQDLEQQIRSSAFDNIVHEHLEYYSLWSLSHLAHRSGLTIQRATQTPINGGSLRVVLRKREDLILPEDSVRAQLLREAALGLDTPTIRDGDLRAFTRFATATLHAKAQIAATVQQILDAGALIDGYGASTKGNITFQILGLGPAEIRRVIDRSPEKAGLFTITGIPICNEEVGRVDPADVMLMAIWQFRDAVIERERAFLERGGTFIVPLPTVEVIRGSWKPPHAR